MSPIAPLITTYISAPPHTDYSHTELKTKSMSVCMCHVRNRGWRQRASGDLYSCTLFLHPSDSFPYFWNTNGRSCWLACIRRLGVGAPSLLLCRSHLLPRLFALLSVAFSCQPINQTYIHTRADTCTHLSAAGRCRPLSGCILPWLLHLH